MRRHRRLAGLCWVLTVAVATVLLSAQGALAHASLVRADPAPGSVMENAPDRVTLWFAEPVEAGFSDIRVVDSNGNQVDNGDSAIYGSDPKALSVTLKPIEHGLYTVSWRNASALDGHPLRGSYTFAVGHEVAPGGASASRPADLQSPLEAIFRWLSLLGSLAVVGGFTFHLLVVRPSLNRNAGVVRSLANRLDAVTWVALGLLLVAELARLVVQTSTLYEIPAVQAIGGPAVSVLSDTEWGKLWVYRIILSAFIALVMAWPRRGRPAGDTSSLRPWLTLGIGASLLLTFSLASHGSALADLRVAGTVTDYLHLLAAAFWVGGLLHLLAGMPVLLGLSPVERTAALSSIVPRFSLVAGLSVGTLVITGLYSAWAMAGTTLVAYYQTAYGLSLLAKVALIVPLLMAAAVNLFWVKPRLAGADMGRLLRRLVLVEVSLAILVLLTAGFLTTLEPARAVAAREGLAQEQARVLHAETADKHLSLVVEPGQLGTNRLLVLVSDLRGSPIKDADVSLRVAHNGGDVEATDLMAMPTGDGEYATEDVMLGVAGSWVCDLTVRSRGSFDARASITFNVATAGRPASGQAPGAAGTLLFGVEILVLGLLFQGTAWLTGGWRAKPGALVMRLGGAASVLGLVFVVAAILGLSAA